eukprot:COSAG01_NODE_10173_length_2230_cov_29.525575_3_plen_138_part_00
MHLLSLSRCIRIDATRTVPVPSSLLPCGVFPIGTADCQLVLKSSPFVAQGVTVAWCGDYMKYDPNFFGRDACFGTAEIQIRQQILDHYLLLDSGLNNYEIIHAALGDTQRAGRRATVKDLVQPLKTLYSRTGLRLCS